MVNDMDKYYLKFVEGLKFIAVPFAEQKKLIPDYAFVCDEIMMTFDDIHIFTKQLYDVNKISKNVVDEMNRLDKQFYFMIGLDNDEIWKYENMDSNIHWIKSKEIASNILNLLGEKIEPPISI